MKTMKKFAALEYDPTLVDNPRPQRENQNVTGEN